MEAITVNAEEYGIQEVKAKEISAMFKPMLDTMVDLEKDANKVFKMPIDQAAAAAKEVRLKYVKVRTGTADIHKQQKAFYLSAGRFIDGWKNAQLLASEGVEDRLKGIENHAEIQEQKRVEGLQEERSADIHNLIDYDVPGNLGEMDQAMYDNYKAGVQVAYDQRIAAAAAAEKKRLADEKAAADETERVRKENEQLKAQQEKDKKKIAAQQKSHARSKAILKEKEDAELKRAEDAAAAAEVELNKGDAAKVEDLVADLSLIRSSYKFKSKKNRQMYVDVINLVDKVIAHIRK